MSNDVLTPGGYRPREQVAQVESGNVVSNIDEPTIGWKSTVGKYLNLIAFSTFSFAGIKGGWVTYVWWANRTRIPIVVFRTRWTVPGVPLKASGQTLFIFNGIQDALGQRILQPVLQWGNSNAVNAEYWTISSWFVSARGNAYNTPPLRVLPGEIITGVMTYLGRDPNGNWLYRSEFEGRPETVKDYVSNAELCVPCVTLEAYNIVEAGNYPNEKKTRMENKASTFQNLDLDPSWAVVDVSKDSGIYSELINALDVDIHYPN